MKKVNDYEFKKGITKKLLEEAGFTNKNPKHLYYGRELCEEISLNIDIPVTETEIDLDRAKIMVLDEILGDYYLPFYLDDSSLPYLDKVIDSYNFEMDLLTNQGILEKVITTDKTETINQETTKEHELPPKAKTLLNSIVTRDIHKKRLKL